MFCYISVYSNGAEMVTVDDYFTNQNVGDFAATQNAKMFWTGVLNSLGTLLNPSTYLLIEIQMMKVDL